MRILKYYGWEDGFLKKQNPESYVHMQKKYAINFVVGDRELDIIPATKLGITTCAFQNEAIPGADYYIDSYHQLFHILKEKSMQI